MVERLVSETTALLAPGPGPDMLSAIGTLLGTFPSQHGNEKARAAGFGIALRDLPAWAVEAAVERWLRGEDGDGTENYAFAPSPPQLRRLALRAKAIIEGRLWRLNRLLAAEVVQPRVEGPYVDPGKINEILVGVHQRLASDVPSAGPAPGSQEAIDLAAEALRVEARNRTARVREEAASLPPLQDAAE